MYTLNSAGLRKTLTTLAKAAVKTDRDYAEANPDATTHTFNNDTDLLLIALRIVRDAQDKNSGGVPWVCGAPGDTHNEDGLNANAAIGLLEVHAILANTGTNASTRVFSQFSPSAMAEAIFDNIQSTFEALGVIPAASDAADPTKVGVARDFIPKPSQPAMDTTALSATANACYYYHKHMGQAHPLGALIEPVVARHVLRFKEQGKPLPSYTVETLTGVYGNEDGTYSTDISHGKPKFSWQNDGTAMSNQLTRLRGTL